ncbi:MAG TPA: DNA-3-methyladenine glycosylase I [Leptospiraceae bacterium]|nr:DNA-3-methyladenine glycosylase I [Leptospiraceae bacterium]HMW06433.1 DNA-3-methyladenine glycosylase I [Leptospiraceae bacterium]HMX31521.1 DNA-3-methyladenine glycosylase I [Leptospiraceae bacterium]HMY31940.1 DNA-3-methyladenine glycosylase I [Leptospiraceae bacterium]HMZ63195.1 DNA-3-methyladenine glycosylase I [Leptospiraceae bacterium]
MNSNKKIFRCNWTGDDSLMIEYHDREWGVPVHDDKKHFEFLILDAFQAGLSWRTILHRREGFRKAFADFEVEKVARFREKKLLKLMQDESIIRNRLKIYGSVQNAKSFIQIQKEFGSFDKYIWQFTNYKTIINHWESMKEIPAKTKESDTMSKDLKKRGFTFVGSTICYAYMQAAGMVNDHLKNCFRHKQVKK